MNIFQELLKCQESFSYFVESYVKITSPTKGCTTLSVYPFQNNLIDLYEKEKYIVVVKFRQGGFSTMTVLYGLWKCIFFQDQKFLFISKTKKEAKHLGQIVNIVLHNFPEWLKVHLSKNTENVKLFSMTKSEMSFQSPEGARGQSATHVVIDEAAFIPNMEKHWEVISECLDYNADVKCFVASTPNGKFSTGSWFYNFTKSAIKKENNFIVFNTSYTEHPMYQDNEFVTSLKNSLSEEAWQQEILGKFIDHDKCLVSKLYELSKKVLSDEDKLLILDVIDRIEN